MMLFTACGKKDTGKTVVYWSMWDAAEPQGVVIADAIKAFTEKTGIKVDVQFKGRTGIREGLQPALDAGTVIDLFDEDIDRINATFAPYLMDLEEMAKGKDYEKTANVGLMAACRAAAGGSLKSIPYQPNVFAVFYNKAIFEKAGIATVPATWAEFLDCCEKIKTAGFIPMTSDNAYIDCNLAYQLGRYIGEEAIVDVVKNGKWAEEPAVLKAAQDIETMATKGYFSPNIASNVWPAGQNGEFALGEVAMYLNGSWLPNEVKDVTGPDFQWGCFSYPAVEGGKTGVESSNFGSQVFAINAKSEVAPEAFDLICWLTKGEWDKKLADGSMGMPADSTNTEWPKQMSDVAPVMAGLTTRFVWAVGIESNPDMTPVIIENFTKLCGGALTAQGFVDAMEAASK
ncbi:MAG: ABC transporter substrate-binding protein [Clostridia bacterium]